MISSFNINKYASKGSNTFTLCVGARPSRPHLRVNVLTERAMRLNAFNDARLGQHDWSALRVETKRDLLNIMRLHVVLLLLTVIGGFVAISADKCPWYHSINPFHSQQCGSLSAHELEPLSQYLDAHIVGHARQKRTVLTAIEAHYAQRGAGTLLLMFIGHQGHGKTLMAEALAEGLLPALRSCDSDECRRKNGYVNLGSQVKFMTEGKRELIHSRDSHQVFYAKSCLSFCQSVTASGIS